MKNFKTLLLMLVSFSGFSSLAQNPDWQVRPADYQFSMNITGVLVNGCVFSGNPSNRVAAFVGDELRGTATFSTEFNDLALAFLTVFSNSATGETLTFKAYDSENDELIDLAVQVLFAENAVKGVPENPFQFYTDAPVVKGNLELKSESTIQYSETIPGAIFTWYKDGAFLSSGEANTISVCRSGWYKVEVENGSCSKLKDSIQFTGNDQHMEVNKNYSNSKLSHIISVNACNESFSDYSFELIDGEGAVDNHLFEIDGDTLKLKPGVSQTKIDYTIKVKATDSFGNSFEQVVELEYIALSIKEALSNQIKVYPNPIQSGWLNINLSDNINDISSYKLLTSEGIVLVSGMKLYGSSHALQLPENLNPGMYILEMEINGQLVHKKLVKE